VASPKNVHNFTSVADRQRIEAVYSNDASCLAHILYSEVLTISKLDERSDDKLFADILHIYTSNQFHVLYNSLPEETVLPYNSTLDVDRIIDNGTYQQNQSSRIVDASFIVRVLYKDIYYISIGISFSISSLI